MNSHIDIIDKDLLAVNFEYVKMGFIKDLTYSEAPGSTVQKVVTIANNGAFIVNKTGSKQDFEQVVRMVKAIMNLKEAEIFKKQGFASWVSAFLPSGKQYTVDQAMQILKVKGFEGFWTIYWNLCEAEKTRRKVKKDWMKKHPLQTLKDFLKERW